MTSKLTQTGFSFVEMLVVTALMSVIGLAGFILLTSGQAIWSITDTKIELQESLRDAAQRLSVELQETTFAQSTIVDGAGIGGSDILRFRVPLCLCGTSPIDENGDVKYWGAPAAWGQAGCSTAWTLENNGKVRICHLPPGNPGNEQDLQVAPTAVKAHLAHGDRIGDCEDCDPAANVNDQIEYLLNADGQLVRRVLDTAANVVNTTIMARNVVDFQATYTGTTIVNAVISLEKQAVQTRLIEVSRTANVYMRN